MKRLRIVTGTLFSVGMGSISLAGCVTLSPATQAQFSETIFAALTQSPDRLQASTDAGDGHAQLSYALVLQYGLNGMASDVQKADAYRQKATASRGSTASAVYMPGYKKAPGHTQLITVPRYDVTELEAQSVETCTALLAAGAEGENVTDKVTSGICGGPQNYARLASLWQHARSQR